MAHIDFITKIHNKTKRDYLERVVKHDKAACAKIAKKFAREYWDGDRKFGYGGFRYDGRWKSVAEKLARHYHLKAGMKVLDVGCGKGFLLYDLMQTVPGLECRGIDTSAYAIKHAPKEVRPFLKPGLAQELPYQKNSFDLVISINTLHNLHIFDLKKAVGEINRVSKKNAYIVVESYRNEREKANLLYWQLTCECFFTPKEWEWLFSEFGYQGDYSFIFFE
jgi:ubiquinone/menaquinone biosynthesis C-methylase UbiE